MDQVWILEQGEDYGGGHVVGVYLNYEDGFADFVTTVTGLHFMTHDLLFSSRRDLGRKVWREESDGSVHAHAGCDWVSYSPHPVRTRPQITE